MKKEAAEKTEKVSNLLKKATEKNKGESREDPDNLLSDSSSSSDSSDSDNGRWGRIWSQRRRHECTKFSIRKFTNPPITPN